MNLPYPVLVLILFVVSFLTWHGWKKYQKNHPPPTTSPTTPKGSTGVGLRSVIAVAFVVVALTWWFTNSQAQRAKEASTEMVFEWTSLDGQLHRGLASDILQVRNLSITESSISFDTPYSYGGRTQVGNYYLEMNGGWYKGSWSQRAPKDSGLLELKKVGDMVWTGMYTDQSGQPMTGTLRPKTSRR